MAKQKITLTKDALTEHVAIVLVGQLLTTALKALDSTRFTAIPPDYHAKIMAIQQQLVALDRDLCREITPELHKLYNGY